MGLRINVYRPADGHDCTNDGISSRVNELTLVTTPGPFDPTPDAPAAYLVKGHTPGTARIVWRPIGGEGKHVMFGGNYGATSDSRFTRHIEDLTGAPFYGAVPIHDRYED